MESNDFEQSNIIVWKEQLFSISCVYKLIKSAWSNFAVPVNQYFLYLTLSDKLPYSIKLILGTISTVIEIYGQFYLELYGNMHPAWHNLFYEV